MSWFQRLTDLMDAHAALHPDPEVLALDELPCPDCQGTLIHHRSGCCWELIEQDAGIGDADEVLYH